MRRNQSDEDGEEEEDVCGGLMKRLRKKLERIDL